MLRWTGSLISLALPTLAALAVTIGPAAAACRLVSPPDAEGRWIVDDGRRKIAYRLSGRSHPRFELRIEKRGSLADPQIVCRGCPAGATLGLVWQFAGVSDIPPMYVTPEALRLELKRAEGSKGMTIRPMSDTGEIMLAGFKGWAMPVGYADKKHPDQTLFALLYGYLSDDCGAIVLLADTNPVFGGGPSPIRLPAEEIMRLLGEMLQSITLSRDDP